MIGFERNHELGAVFERWGNAVAIKAAKRRRRESTRAKPSEMPYVGHSESQIANALADAKRRTGEKDDDALPYEPSPPLVPALPQVIGVDAERSLRLIEAASKTADTTKAVQYELL